MDSGSCKGRTNLKPPRFIICVKIKLVKRIVEKTLYGNKVDSNGYGSLELDGAPFLLEDLSVTRISSNLILFDHSFDHFFTNFYNFSEDEKVIRFEMLSFTKRTIRLDHQALITVNLAQRPMSDEVIPTYSCISVGATDVLI